MEPCRLFLVTFCWERGVCSLVLIFGYRRMGRVGHLNLAIESVPRLFRFVPSLLDGDDRVIFDIRVAGFGGSAGSNWCC